VPPTAMRAGAPLRRGPTFRRSPAPEGSRPRRRRAGSPGPIRAPGSVGLTRTRRPDLTARRDAVL
jgi:hypothetical protein